MRGARAAQKSVVAAYPDSPIDVFVVWVDMVPGDDRRSAQRSARIFRDPAVRQFHDPEARSGSRVAESLGGDGSEPAWDVYLFYDRQADWDDRPPEPAHWAHQLGGVPQEYAAHYRTGANLEQWLRSTAGAMLSPPAAP